MQGGGPTIAPARRTSGSALRSRASGGPEADPPPIGVDAGRVRRRLPYLQAVEPEVVVVALVPVIAVVAYVGGVTQGHPRRRLALAASALASAAWIALLIALKLGSS